MKILLIDNGTSLLDKLQDLIPGSEITHKSDTLDGTEKDKYDLFILSGSSRYSATFDYEIFKNEINLIKNSQKPIVGICFGCELIAKAFGGDLIELPEKEKGIFKIEMLDPIFGFMEANVYEAHRWALNQIPENFEILAKSERGPEIIKHKTLPIYGLQFHPENLVKETQGDELFIKILDKIFNK